MNSAHTAQQNPDDDDDARRPFTVGLTRSPDHVLLPMWPMLRADVSPAARCLVPLIIANSYRVFGDQAYRLTTDVASTVIGADWQSAMAELVRIGFLSEDGTTFHSEAPLEYRGPRNLGEACELYRDFDSSSVDGG